MSNKIYGDYIYNPDAKNRFMNQYEGKANIERVFKISYDMENDFGKDLFDFNREQIRKLGYLFMPSTKNSSVQNIRYIETYIDWAIDEGLTKGVNPLIGVDKEWKEQFANENLKLLWRKDEIDHIVLSRRNGQDQAIITLLWNGVKGKNNVEIVKLKRTDINDKEGILVLFDENDDNRKISVDQQCIATCLKAYSESEYESKNGNVSKEAKNSINQLVISDEGYIIRPSNTQVKHYGISEKNIVYRRIASIADEIEEPMFNPRNIVNSGMLYLAYQVYNDTGKLSGEDIKLICGKFGLLKSNIDGVEYSKIVMSTLNIETIKKVYNL